MALIPSRTFLLQIEHIADTPISYLQLENVETEGPVRLVWPQQSYCFDADVLQNAYIWKELAATPQRGISTYRNLRWKDGFGETMRKFLVLGERGELYVNGELVRALEEPFFAFLMFYNPDASLKTSIDPFLALVQFLDTLPSEVAPDGVDPSFDEALDGRACECGLIRIRSEGAGQAQLTSLALSECSGRIRLPDRLLTFHEYDHVELGIHAVNLERRHGRTGEYFIPIVSSRIVVNGSNQARSIWDSIPSAVQWAIYGVVTFFWLPIASEVQKKVFRRSSS